MEDQLSQFPIPGLLSEDGVKMSYTHAPTKDECRIFWGHSSWRSFPRGDACNFTLCMIPTKNLHWLIRAQLAKRGGHRSHMRISHDAVPGYIAALRETNDSGDVEDRPKASLQWKPKAIQPQPAHNDGVVHPNEFTHEPCGMGAYREISPT